LFVGTKTWKGGQKVEVIHFEFRQKKWVFSLQLEVEIRTKPRLFLINSIQNNLNY